MTVELLPCEDLHHLLFEGPWEGELGHSRLSASMRSEARIVDTPWCGRSVCRMRDGHTVLEQSCRRDIAKASPGSSAGLESLEVHQKPQSLKTLVIRAKLR